MPVRTHRRFTLKDYVSLGVAVSLAFAVWLVYSLSRQYSDIVQCNVQAVCELDGRSNVSDKTVTIAARCQMRGYDILYFKLFSGRVLQLHIDGKDLVHQEGSRFYLPQADLKTYLYDIYGENCKVEYFMTDTVFFDFPQVECRKLPVNFIHDISFNPQYTSYEDMYLNPDSVFVYGKMDILERLTCVNTKPLVFRNVDGTLLGEVAFEDIPNVRVGADKVNYEIPVCRFVEEIREVDVVVTDVPQGCTVHPYPSTAKLTIREIFPSEDALMDNLFVAIPYSEFQSSRTGRCTGHASNLSGSVISCQIDPSFFDCTEEMTDKL